MYLPKRMRWRIGLSASAESCIGDRRPCSRSTRPARCGLDCLGRECARLTAHALTLSSHALTIITLPPMQFIRGVLDDLGIPYEYPVART